MRQIFLAVLVTLGCAWTQAEARPRLPTPEPPKFEASSYLLQDHNSGQIIAQKNANETVDPASITKLMTAYIVFSELAQNNIALDDMVSVSKKAWQAEGSRMFIEVGDQVSVHDLLRGMIIQSGNDASIALAEHLAGGENSFASWMNQHAERLGMHNTSYRNATGLTHPEHYSTAQDIAILARALINEFPDFYALYSQKEFTFAEITQPNRNRLLWRDASVDGIKTGYTKAAGYCLASSAERDGMRLISVVLGTPSARARERASEALLNYGFRFFETVQVAGDGEAMAEARIWKAAEKQLPLGSAQPVYVTIPRGRSDDLVLKPSMAQRLIAPISAGQRLGSLDVSLDDNALRSVPLVAMTDMPLGSMWQRIRDEIWLLVKR